MSGVKGTHVGISELQKAPENLVLRLFVYRVVGDIGSEQTTRLSGKQHIASQCDAKCDAIPADLVDLLARAVLLVAGMPIPEASREVVLQRVIEELEQG